MPEVKDHGFWVGYIPLKHPEHAPRGAAFCRREIDEQDWYEYVNVEEGNPAHKGREKHFQPKSVKCVLEVKGRGTEAEPVVRCAAVDETRLFPADCHLVELIGIERPQDEAALIKEFANRKFNRSTGHVGELWTPPPMPTPQPTEFETKILSTLDAITARLEKLEGK
jgi:hypothetical protein